MRLMIYRLASLGLTFLVIVTVIFVLLRLTPGGPFDGERALPPDVEANLRAAYHMDKPLVEQYGRYLLNLSQGDLGPSFRQKDFTVNELVAEGLPVSLIIGGLALALALFLGLFTGTFAALYPGRFIDVALMGFINLGLAIPGIIVAPVCVLVFAVLLGWLPAGGIGTPAHYLLPGIAAALPYAAAIARRRNRSAARAAECVADRQREMPARPRRFRGAPCSFSPSR